MLAFVDTEDFLGVLASQIVLGAGSRLSFRAPEVLVGASRVFEALI